MADRDMETQRKILKALLIAAKDGDVVGLEKTVSTHTASAGGAATMLGNYRDGNGRSAIHFAANFARPAVIDYILALAPMLVDARDEEGATPLILCASGHAGGVVGDRIKALDALLKAGANVNATKVNKDSALHLAAHYDLVEVCKWLLSNGADIELVGNVGTPLVAAAGQHSSGVLQALLDAKAEMDIITEDKLTPLMASCASGHSEGAAMLIKAGADVTHVGPDGMTALHFAADRGADAVIDLIVASNAETALVTNVHDLRPVHLAARGEHKDTVAKLLGISGLDPVPELDAFMVEQLEAHKAEIEAIEAAKKKEEERKKLEEEYGPLYHVELPPVASEENAKAAVEAKERGNQLLGTKDINQAILAYTEAIELDGRKHAFWSNRSAAYLKAGMLEEALHDAQMCRRLNPKWVKGRFREGQAFMAMEKYEEAGLTLFEGCKIDADNDEMQAMFKKAVRLGKRAYKKKQEEEEARSKAASSGGGGGGGGGGAAVAEGDASESEKSTDSKKKRKKKGKR